ncbi:MAG TPA: PorV/PorQ family protein [Elusimicrobiota bacterium]|nr:PorV/PorQ family protein [Elusimicrobiota bacterium]
MRTRTLLAAALLTAASAGPAAALGAGSKGTSGAQFLEIAPGARPAAMGGAFAGIADDVHSVYYNPAGLANLQRVEITGMDDQYFQGVDYDFAALAVPLLSFEKNTIEEKNSLGVLGFGVYNLSLGDIPTQGNTETAAPTGTFASQDVAYALSYAYALRGSDLALGATAKYVTSTLDGYNASAFAADAGALYRHDQWSLGAGLRNLGTRYGFAGQSDPLPMLAYAGGGFQLTSRWLLSAEVDAPRDNNLVFAAGTEYVHPFTSRLSGALRGGYNTAATDAGGFSGASFGGGLTYGNFGFDYAFIPFGDLGNTSRYSLVVKF